MQGEKIRHHIQGKTQGKGEVGAGVGRGERQRDV